MKNNGWLKGLIFGVLVTIFNIIYQYFVNNESEWTLFVSSAIGGLIGGAIYGFLMDRRFKKMNSN